MHGNTTEIAHGLLNVVLMQHTSCLGKIALAKPLRIINIDDGTELETNVTDRTVTTLAPPNLACSSDAFVDILHETGLGDICGAQKTAHILLCPISDPQMMVTLPHFVPCHSHILSGVDTPTAATFAYYGPCAAQYSATQPSLS
ncbi:hypothetical protein WG66_014221 [Moniliophthora roreri]|nr:hypothetical protein WG66_014221 [Moniliophthora roreri]